MIQTLAMLKMEKNFVAHIEKNYPRRPYSHYTIGTLIDYLEDELGELIDAYDHLDFAEVKRECADLSNLIDYIFEAATQKELE